MNLACFTDDPYLLRFLTAQIQRDFRYLFLDGGAQTELLNLAWKRRTKVARVEERWEELEKRI